MSIKNILFIMCDQLRWDYLSCYGHPHLQTPNIDKLAEHGVRFDRAYVQAPICCPSRASFYTGRYMSSHGATVNFSAIRPDELGIGDYLKPLGVRTGLAGKTHSFPDREGMARLGIELDSPLGQHLANVGFEPFWRDDGLHPNDQRSEHVEYNQYLREKGYEAQNPWNRFANGTIDENGEWLNGWFLKAGNYPANIANDDSETPFATRRGMAFIDDAGDNPWCLHLSYIKPHWPYIAPPPYDSFYNESHFLPRVANEEEMTDPHPIFEAFTQIQVSRAMQTPEARTAVMKAYMGLIKQIDDQIGELLTFLEDRKLMDNTLIVFTSDHGDYLGDHWMGEKSWFHEPSVRVPLIVVDPSQAGDVTRGTRCDELVEAIDLLPTFIDYLGGRIPDHRLEGRSIRPLLQSANPPENWRAFVVSESDFADRGVKFSLDIPHHECNAIMICTKRWKYIHVDNYRPQLFDLENDPHEFMDLGADEAYTAVVQQMQQHLITFYMRRKSRITLSSERIDNLVGNNNREKRGIYIGFYEEKDLPDEVRRANHNNSNKIV